MTGMNGIRAHSGTLKTKCKHTRLSFNDKHDGKMNDDAEAIPKAIQANATQRELAPSTRAKKLFTTWSLVVGKRAEKHEKQGKLSSE